MDEDFQNEPRVIRKKEAELIGCAKKAAKCSMLDALPKKVRLTELKAQDSMIFFEKISLNQFT